MTCVPAVVTFTPSAWAASIAPAITERAALPVQRKTTWGGWFTFGVCQRQTGRVASLLSRRTVIGAAVAVVLAACSKGRSTSRAATATSAPSGPTSTLAPTPSCGADTHATPEETEGPYFKASSPAKSNLAADVSTGTRLVVKGSVVSTSCQPVKRALLDIWQADAGGQYDNSGYRLRGHLFTDDSGRYRFETVVPGLYPGRTRHIHVKVQAPNGPVLTTQLYFPNEPQNASDSIFQEEMLLTVKQNGAARDGSFDFVVRT
jgi:protocatechuate 3,4-dioxygenase beta subunit